MRLSSTEKRELINILSELLESDKVNEMKEYIQHGNISTYTHSLIVTYYSYLLAIRLPIVFDIRSIVRGAMLHDFYLYDWHIPDPSHRLHGYVHPGFALKNARKYFSLNLVEADIIGKHMWPLTLRKIPIYRESILVSLIDKYCSLAETFHITLQSREFRYLQQHLDHINPI